jgi:hypothetical protein
MAEDMLERSLHAMSYRVERGVEVTDTTPAGTPIRAHLDFVYRNRKRVAVMEAKSTHPIPPIPHEGWEMQLHAQLGVVERNFPNKEISGTIYALDVSPKKGFTHNVWNSYKPDPVLYQPLQEKADLIFNGIQEYKESGNLPDDIEAEPTLLCGYCSHLKDCPKFQEEVDLEGLQDELTKLLAAQSKKKEMKELEDALKEDFKEVLRPIPGWAGVNGHKLRLKQMNSRVLDYEALDAFLNNHGQCLENFRKNQTKEQLDIKPVKNDRQKAA